MTDTTQIRRRPDGSIDTGHYAARAGTLRSEAAHDLASRASAPARRPLVALVSLLAILPFFNLDG